MSKPEIIINELNQKVRVYDWDDLCKRLENRKPLQADTDLNDKVLVVSHTWGLGDVLYSTPAIHRLRQKFPRVNMKYVCMYPTILENNPDINGIIHYLDQDAYSDFVDSIEGDWYWLNFDTPMKGGFSYKIHLRPQPQLNEFMVSLLKKDPDVLSSDEREFINQAGSSVISRYKMVALDMYCKHAFCEDAEKSVYYYPHDYELEMAKRLFERLRGNGKRVITLMPHSSTLYKDYPHWKEVIKLCPNNYYWIILDSSLKQNERWEGPNMYNMSGAFQLRQSAAMVIESDLCCSSDTGLLYVKAARGGKCIVTYGPHDPEPFLHYFPTAHGLRVKSVKGLLEEGQETCSVGCYIDTTSCKTPGSYAPCLSQLSPATVAAKVIEVMEK